MDKSVESFQVECADWQGLFQKDDPIQVIETELFARLNKPICLLRWAVVAVDAETQAYRCEGAYLRAV